MKKVLLFVLFAFLQVSVFGQAKIVFEPASFDVGDVDTSKKTLKMEFKNEKVGTRTFQSTIIDVGDVDTSKRPFKIELKFKNEGNEPLTIYEVISSFYLVTTKFPKTEIAPGQQGVITLSTPFGRTGKRVKSITVKSSGLIELSRIAIKCNVTAISD